MDFLALFALGSASQVLVNSNRRMNISRDNGLEAVIIGDLAAKEYRRAKVWNGCEWSVTMVNRPLSSPLFYSLPCAAVSAAAPPISTSPSSPSPHITPSS